MTVFIISLFFFLQVLPTPASTKGRQSSLSGCIQHFPFILISGMAKCIICHTSETQHWIQNYWFPHRLFHWAILLQRLSAPRALTDVLTGEAGEVVASALQPLKSDTKRIRPKSPGHPLILGPQTEMPWISISPALCMLGAASIQYQLRVSASQTPGVSGWEPREWEHAN